MIGYAAAQHYRSDNYGVRKASQRPSFIILHHTAMTSAEAALERLCSSQHEVSAHYVISSQGDVFQLVSEDKRAWHAGASYWAGEVDLNSLSIGIELDNSGGVPFSFPLMCALVPLIKDIQARWSIPRCHILGHFEIAIARKADPGPKFDWQALAAQGIGACPTANRSEHTDEDRFYSYAKAIGYDPNQGKAGILNAFRQRYRPGVITALDERDCAIIKDLHRQFS